MTNTTKGNSMDYYITINGTIYSTDTTADCLTARQALAAAGLESAEIRAGVYEDAGMTVYTGRFLTVEA